MAGWCGLLDCRNITYKADRNRPEGKVRFFFGILVWCVVERREVANFRLLLCECDEMPNEYSTSKIGLLLVDMIPTERLGVEEPLGSVNTRPVSDSMAENLQAIL